MAGNIDIFTKPNCRFCSQAKETLAEAGLGYTQHDVIASDRDANASVYFSGSTTVPQIFIGGLHVNGSEDLALLHMTGRLTDLAGQSVGSLGLDDVSDEDLRHGAEDLLLRNEISSSDGTRDKDPEQWPILSMYKDFFGFWPNTFAYLHRWPEAYKAFVYDHNGAAIGTGRDALGMPLMSALGYATSNAHGCSYCQVHSATTGGENSIDAVNQLEAAKRGEAGENNPFGPFELALADLVARSSTNSVTDEAVATVRHTWSEARMPFGEFNECFASATMIAAAFGFLNVFNDLTGVKVEADWARQAQDGTGLSAGRHGVDTRQGLPIEPISEGGPTKEDMVRKYAASVVEAGGPAAYAKNMLGAEPAWLRSWPQPLRANHIHLYATIMAGEDTNGITSELKHLMARVSAIAKGHHVLAAAEGHLAYVAAGRTKNSLLRVRATMAPIRDSQAIELFTEPERAALVFAWLSAQAPLATPHRFVDPVLKHFDEDQLITLIVVCSMASLVQRFSSIMRPEVDADTAAFLAEHDLELDTLRLRYEALDEQR
ncbi:Hybrid peroxiredoxin hyPrx5 [Roseivivax jejudonensis]|uniref:Hybrid peroxiredoxin hyPrx5 n=1 Tax=Roseivivax jejudonensis TaxID=1529041 RepID=A0A1X7A6C0_9RHOB|nr:glutaredoxin domain-containing protein [Roseivivax jejudonensis]SLN71213.1 Hybrid peroxiredoxin hyPrx5 [Roseivivax jejudonensis]